MAIARSSYDISFYPTPAAKSSWRTSSGATPQATLHHAVIVSTLFYTLRQRKMQLMMSHCLVAEINTSKKAWTFSTKQTGWFVIRDIPIARKLAISVTIRLIQISLEFWQRVWILCILCMRALKTCYLGNDRASNFDGQWALPITNTSYVALPLHDDLLRGVIPPVPPYASTRWTVSLLKRLRFLLLRHTHFLDNFEPFYLAMNNKARRSCCSFGNFHDRHDISRNWWRQVSSQLIVTYAFINAQRDSSQHAMSYSLGALLNNDHGLVSA